VARKDICGENSGFLTLRRCDKEAVARCSFCNKPVCEEHGPKGASGGIACITCIREKKDQLPPQSQDQYRPGYPYFDNYGPLYGSYYYDDYSPYSVHDRFDERDYAVFNAEAPGQGEQGFEGS
jgi:hypothetical protein